MKSADLHLHTVFSDGTYTPDSLIKAAQKAGLSAISIVDHDITDGIRPTQEAAAAFGIEVISGIELSCEFHNQEIHILGYLIDIANKSLQEKLGILQKYRIERIHRITDKLKDAGVNLEPDKVFALSTGGTIGRLHVARALLKEGFVSSIYESFAKYIGDNSPAYVCGFHLAPKDAIGLIKSAGGIPVLAHPYTVRNDELIIEFIKEGLMGLEAYYPEHSQSMVNFYLELAQKYGLLVTGGSDCHGDAKPEVKIGSMKIPYSLVEKLKEAREKL